MKPNLEMMFGNIFDDIKITAKYLERFADDTIANLTQNNTANELTSILDPLVAAMIPFKAELGEVDITTNQLLGNTQMVDDFIAGFIGFMKDNYIIIAGKLGSDKTPAFLEFYPHGKTEYINITKTKMPTVVARLQTAATNYATDLGPTITAQLQAFKPQWIATRNAQLKAKAALKINRTDQGVARTTVEICLLTAIRFIAHKYVNNVPQCKNFFKFELLFGVTHHTGAQGIATENGVPKANVSINVLGTNKTVDTDNKGEYKIIPISAGTITMKASTESGKVVSKQVTINPGHITDVNFDL